MDNLKEEMIMSMFGYIVLVGGLYSVIMALLMNVKNSLSGLLFKIIPFFIGLSCIIYALNNLGVIDILK